MEKKEVIQKLTDLGVSFNPGATVKTLTALLEKHSEGEVNSPEAQPAVASQPVDATYDLLKKIADGVSVLSDRVAKLEGTSTNEHMRSAKSEDIASASEKNSKLDPRIVKIVEETLGSDFVAELDAYEDRPGYLFTVIVPTRLSDFKKDHRPVLDENGEYKKDARGSVVTEEYTPEDRRSRSLGSADSFAAITEHCTRVRSNIVDYYQKLSKPAPEFKYIV